MLLAILSALSLTAMVIFDKLMIKDCYEGDVNQALFVSTFASTILGLFATMLCWLLWSTPITEFAHTFWQLLSPYGFLIMLAGALSSLVLKHYFSCFSLNGDSTVIASWLAVSPVFVYFGMYLLAVIGVIYEPVHFSVFILSTVVVISVSLFFLERISYEANPISKQYRKHLALMLLFNTSYVLLIDQTLAHAATHTNIATHVLLLSLLPMYWFGLACGMTTMLQQKDRAKLLQNLYIPNFLFPLLIVEILGMLVFFFEFLSLGNLDSVSVSIVVGLHVLPVWIISTLVSRYARTARFSPTNKIRLFGLELSKETLDEFSIQTHNVFLQVLLVSTTVVGVILFLSATQSV